MWLLLAACTRVDEVDLTAPPIVEEAPEVAPAIPEPYVPPSPLVINEVQPSNRSTAMDAAGAFPDWFELYNRSDEAIDLAQVEVAQGDRIWRGAGELAPRGWLRVWAGDGQAAGFPLPREQGELVLRLGGEEVDRVAWASLPSDTAMARVPDAQGWAVTARPTPGWTNGSRPTDSEDPTDLLFQHDVVRTVQLWLPAASRAALAVDPYTDVPASMAFEGAFFPSVGVHIKGRYGSFRPLSGKSALKVDLNEYADHELRGMETLTLNNMVQDASYLHESLAYALYRAVGVPAPRTGYAWVYVDDELFGLYLNVETVDDVFLDRWYADGSGPMWEGSYGIDFEPGEVETFEYDEGPEPEDKTPLRELTELLAGERTPAALQRLTTMVDLDEFLTMYAVEAVIYHWDGYMTENNYRVYHDPSTDLLTMLPWGTDQTWLPAWMDIYDGNGDLFQFCLAIRACRAAYDDRLRVVAEAIEDEDFAGQLDALATFLAPNVRRDVRGEHGYESFEATVRSTLETIEQRPAEILARVP
jgi:hypothetical protein